MTIRRKPKQARSLKRYHHILETSAHLFEDMGVEATTTNHIAEHANISIGSLYQYFPNKEAILEGLVARYLEAYREFNAKKFEVMNIETLSMTELIHHTIDAIIDFESSHVGFHTIFAQSAQLSEQISQATTDLHMEVIDQVIGLMQARFPTIPIDHVRLYASVVVSMVKNIKVLTSPPDNLVPHAVVAEIKIATLAYIRSILLRENLPIPDDLT